MDIIVMEVMEYTVVVMGALDMDVVIKSDTREKQIQAMDIEVMDLPMFMFIRLIMDMAILNHTAMATTFMEVMVMERDLLRLNQAMDMEVMDLPMFTCTRQIMDMVILNHTAMVTTFMEESNSTKISIIYSIVCYLNSIV